MASTSHNHTSSASASTSPLTQWEVFLSFRGTDTRYTFTDHLYKALHRTGIRTFKDDPELRSGDVISYSLIQAITESKTYIVVLSENYASSSWCLDELVEILACYKRMKRLVVPVFYYMDPSVARHQTGSFKEAFEKHQTRFGLEKVNKWRLTLNEVADFSGYHISKNRSEADIVDEVVGRVLLEINPITLDVAKYPVGLDSRVEGVIALFNGDTEGVIRIGIHGMGGVGKTTLAKAVYNQTYGRFPGSCFLANVREVSRTKGLVCLQQQLINDVLKRKDLSIDNVDNGIKLISARICSTRVLLVIDDLDDPKPLRYLEGSFASGSVLIVTTRNEDLLDRIKVKAKYKVNQLDKDESHQLFTQHAFGEDKMSKTFTELSKQILEHAGGLPLALQVFGSTLLNESEDGWRWFIDKLNRAPSDDVEESLMISFDALKSIDPNLQDIFLDIACFCIGWKKEKVAKILQTFYTFVNHKIDILKKRCLITIDDEDKLGMHDLLQDMGSGIARNNSPGEPGKHSRLWVLQDIHSVLKNHKGTEAIQGIISSNFYYKNALEEEKLVSFAAETFKRMSKLRFLYLNNVNLTGSFEHTFEDLRWFCWEYFPLKCLPSDFYAQKLVTLDLRHSKMRTMWEEHMVSQGFNNLKTLNMSNSPNLTTTSDFTRFLCLETLNYASCCSLEEVHISIGSLARLVSLNLGYCISLRSLPDSICSLRALKVLTVTGCSRLEALPTELGNIESLKEFFASGLSVSELPDSIRRLSSLVELCLSHNENLETLPDGICNLRSLKILDIRKCEKLNNCLNLLSIPNLIELWAEYCMSIKTLPNLANLKQLESLNLKGCSGLTENLDLDELTSLVYLNLRDCGHLLSISKLAPNLKCMKAKGCTSIRILPDLSNLKQLEILDLRCCSGLTEIQGLEELTSLQKLSLEGCNPFLLAYTLTKRFFQKLSGFGHRIVINIASAEYPDWISQSSECVSPLSLHLQPNASHNFLAIILTFGAFYDQLYYSVVNTTSGVMWKEYIYETCGCVSSIVIVPSSIFAIRDGDYKIEIASDKKICGIHPLYRTEVTIVGEYDSTTDDVEDERCHSSLSDLRSNKNLLFPASTTVNVEEEGSNLSLGASNKNWLSIDSTTRNAEEETRYPSKRLKRSVSDN